MIDAPNEQWFIIPEKGVWIGSLFQECSGYRNVAISCCESERTREVGRLAIQLGSCAEEQHGCAMVALCYGYHQRRTPFIITMIRMHPALKQVVESRLVPALHSQHDLPGVERYARFLQLVLGTRFLIAAGAQQRQGEH